MIRVIFLTILMLSPSWADEIKISHTKHKKLGKILEANAKIIQLSNQKQQIVSRLGGHLAEYFVKSGQRVKKGDKIAKIKSLELSNMSASYFSLKKRLKVARQRVNNANKLYKKGLVSLQELSSEELALSNIEAKLNGLKSQLNSLDIELKKTTDSYIIKAHADGKIEKLLVSLHANLDAQTPIVSLVGDSGYHAKAYLPVLDSFKNIDNLKANLIVNNKNYNCKFVSLLPNVDELTGQAQMIFWIESGDDMLLLDAYHKIEIEFGKKRDVVVVKKSALSMFDGEWVLFVPAEEEHHEDEEEKEHQEHDDKEKEDEHAHHEHQDHEEVPFSLKVVEVVDTFGDEVAVRGIKEGQEYVSDGVYFVKSMLLKSKLGGHGH
jgi:RND family efflux transporter MFP subunit